MPFDKNPEPFLKCLPADQSGKDPRSAVLAFVESFYQWYNSLPYDDRPNRLQINRSSYVDDSTDTITRSYNFTFETAAASLSVLEEKANEV